LQTGELVLVENVGHEAHVLDNDETFPVTDSHPGGLLTAVLKGVEAIESHVSDLGPRRTHAEDPAGFARRAAVDVVGSGRNMFGFGLDLAVLNPVRRHVLHSLTRNRQAPV